LETLGVPSPLPPVVAAHARSAKLPPSPWSFPTSSSPSTTYVVIVMELVHVNAGAPTAPIPLEQRHLTSTHPQLWPPPSSSPSAAAVEAKTEHTILTAHLRRLARAGSLDEIDAFLAPQCYSPPSSLPLPRTSTPSSACCHNVEEVRRLHESSRPDPAFAVLTCSSAVSLSRASVVSTRFDAVGSPTLLTSYSWPPRVVASPGLLHAIPPSQCLDL
jgi:hypothetical protein